MAATERRHLAVPAEPALNGRSSFVPDCHDEGMTHAVSGLTEARALLIGREVSAVCFVRDYVELHFDGPVLRALTDPSGLYGCTQWRFPDGHALTRMRSYIGKVVDDFVIVPHEYAQLAFGEHSFLIPLDDASRRGPEALHIVGDDRDGTRHLWIY
jgi:hypothetical protein